MQKLDMLTPDILAQNIEALARLFPNIITETENADGTITKAIDYDLFRQMFASTLVEGGEERYRLDWPGKRASILKANTPIDKTLRPVVADSVNWDRTENLYIEGDNFEVLKVLQESYLGKVKMIYIDPPYNKGKDFIYKDNSTISQDEYNEGLEIVDANGGLLLRNTDTNGRFHSDWLSMLYERMLVAKDLLTQDGGVFISIDQDEVHNLRKICDEIFGEENFVNQIVVKMSEMKGAKLAHVDRKFPKITEYLLIYAKNKDAFILNPVKSDKGNDELEKYSRYYNKKIIDINDPVEDWKFESVSYGFEQKMLEAESMIYLVKPDKDKNLNIPKNQFAIITNTEGKNDVFFNENGEIKKVLFLKENSTTYLGDLWLDISTININKESYDIPTYTNGQKPLDLLYKIIQAFLSGKDLAMDFFSGSGTFGDAILRCNQKFKKRNKFILVQVNEKVELTTGMDQETRKATEKMIEFLDSIDKTLLLTEIGKERLRRSGKKIMEENKDKESIENLDIGFRVYRLDSSNMKDIYYHPTEVTQDSLFDMESNIKSERTPEDILAQVMLDLGLTLDLSIEKRIIHGSTVFYVANNSLVACFDEHVDFALVDTIAQDRPLRVVLRDSSFSSDADRINFETRFAKLSPETDIRVI